MKAKIKTAPGKKAPVSEKSNPANRTDKVILIGPSVHPFAIIEQVKQTWEFQGELYANRKALTDALDREGCRWRETTMKEINRDRFGVGTRVNNKGATA